MINYNTVCPKCGLKFWCAFTINVTLKLIMATHRWLYHNPKLHDLSAEYAVLSFLFCYIKFGSQLVSWIDAFPVVCKIRLKMDYANQLF